MTAETGSVVRAKAGADAGKLFFVLRTDERRLYLADGKRRTVQKPKQKNRSHVETLLLQTDTPAAAKLRSGEAVLNSELRRELAAIRSKNSQNQGG